jgi:hypothetical protein
VTELISYVEQGDYMMIGSEAHPRLMYVHYNTPIPVERVRWGIFAADIMWQFTRLKKFKKRYLLSAIF